MSVYVLGGAQTDFARNYSRQGEGLYEMLRDAVFGAFEATSLEPKDIEAAHIGNFTGELFAGQGHLGGMFAALDPALAGVPAARHEAACASGSVALLAASAEIEAGRYDAVCVAGVEQMRNVDGTRAAQYLGAAAWSGREALNATFLWPAMFSDIADAYDRRYGVRYDALMAFARQAIDNARRNPHAQTRNWRFDEAHFAANDDTNPIVEGRVRKQDCGRITDGAAALVLASEGYARRYAKRRGLSLAQVPRIAGWGHRTAPLLLADRLNHEGPFLFPELRGAITDAWRRAGIESSQQLDGIELHDCFTITAYAIVDHLRMAEEGAVHTLTDSGALGIGGRLPINPSGGLIGAGHPVGATGVRMLLDAAKQLTGTAGDYQIEGAKRMQTINIGGSFTTTVSFVLERDGS